MKSKLVTEKYAKQELGDYYKMANEYSDYINFKATLMKNPSLLGDNTFSRKLIKLRGEEGGDKKISGHLSRVSICKEFSHHDGYKFTADGQMLEESDDDNDQEEFKTFLQAAIENDATEVTKTKEDAVQECCYFKEEDSKIRFRT